MKKLKLSHNLMELLLIYMFYLQLPGKKSRKKEPITSFSADTPLCPLPSQSNQHLTED